MSSTRITSRTSARRGSQPSPSLIESPFIDYLTGKVSTSDSIEFLVPKNPRFSDLALPLVDEYRPDDVIVSGSNDAVEPGTVDDKARVYGETERIDYISLIRASERPLKDREALLECEGRNFHDVLTASTRREEERQRFESQQRKDGLVAKSRLMSADERGLGGGYGDELGYDPKAKLEKGFR